MTQHPKLLWLDGGHHTAVGPLELHFCHSVLRDSVLLARELFTPAAQCPPCRCLIEATGSAECQALERLVDQKLAGKSGLPSIWYLLGLFLAALFGWILGRLHWTRSSVTSDGGSRMAVAPGRASDAGSGSSRPRGRGVLLDAAGAVDPR